MTASTPDLAALRAEMRAKAEKARSRHRWRTDESTLQIVANDTYLIADLSDALGDREANAVHIAACCPANILALFDAHDAEIAQLTERAEAAERERDEALKWDYRAVTLGGMSLLDQINRARSQRDELAQDAINAESCIATLTAELEEAKTDVDRLTDENSDLRSVPWPEWATKCLDIVRSYSGYDGYDDADGVDLPQELEDALSEMEREASAQTAVKRAILEVERHKSSGEHYRVQAGKYRAELETARRCAGELATALEPFAAYAEATEPGDWAGDGEVGEQYRGGLRRSIKLSALRRAARVLAEYRARETPAADAHDENAARVSALADARRREDEQPKREGGGDGR